VPFLQAGYDLPNRGGGGGGRRGGGARVPLRLDGARKVMRLCDRVNVQGAADNSTTGGAIKVCGPSLHPNPHSRCTQSR
jgi:hypothetical protein